MVYQLEYLNVETMAFLGPCIIAFPLVVQVEKHGLVVSAKEPSNFLSSIKGMEKSQAVQRKERSGPG